jgi:hypothetical protein
MGRAPANGLRGLAITAVAALLIAALVGAADGKKKGGSGKLAVLTTQQHQAVDAGAISVKVKGKGGRVVVDGVQGTGSVQLTSAQKVKPGKHTVNVPLSAAGRSAMGECSVTALSARFVKGGKKKVKKSAGKSSPAIPLDRDEAGCSVGSENPTARPYHGPSIDTSNANRCDFMDPTICLQPWPNDYFTKADPTTDTGRRLDINTNSTPANVHGFHIDTTDINRADGFSPGNLITLKIPQVETQAAFDNTGFVPVNDLHRYSDPNQPVVVIDAATGARQPIFAELDANPNHYSPGDTKDVNLIIRPTRNFTEGHRYIVALRGLRDAQNNPVDPPLPFRVYRDRLLTSDPAIENRRPHMEDLISTLQQDGIQRSNLYMTWDFTVASEHSLAGRALAIRDNALHQLGDDSPGNGTVDGSAPSVNIPNSAPSQVGAPGVTDYVTCASDGTPGCEQPGDTGYTGTGPSSGGTYTGPPQSDQILRQVDGDLTNVPCYLNNGDCHPGGTLNYQANGDVIATPTGTADDVDRTWKTGDPQVHTTGVDFRCVVPRSVVAGGTLHPAESGIFGHGLLGLYDQVTDTIKFTNSLANTNNSVWCATSWAGFSTDDLGQVIGTLNDVSNFSKLSDRMIQGFVNMIYLGRAMVNPGGLSTNPAFSVDPDGGGSEVAGSAIDPAKGLYWEGISQGAIMGGALTALEPDLTQSVLDVTGMNYSTLLRRSADSAQYFELPNLGLYDNYPNQQERPLLLSLMQLLWDRGEADGYAQHMTSDPLPNTPPHHVLLQLAYGDHQVSNLAAETEARTIGAQVETPALDPGRHWDVNPFLGIPAISSYPFSGSAAMVYYDGGPIGFDGDQDCTDEHGNPQHGTAPAPLVELAPNPVSVYGCDPHSYPRRSLDGVTQAADWLQPSGFIHQCQTAAVGRPCYSNGYTGPGP